MSANSSGIRIRVGPHIEQSDLRVQGEFQQSQLKNASNDVGESSKAHIYQGELRLILRFLSLIVAVLYVVASIMSVSAALSILWDKEERSLPPDDYPNALILFYAGTGTIGVSPLVKNVLESDTNTNRTDALYLESEASHSYSGCSTVQDFNSHLYGAEFLRYMFIQMKTQLAYNISIMGELELILPVVDCTSLLLLQNDFSSARVFYLVHQASNSTKVLLVSASFAIQNYYIPIHHRQGPALFTSIAFIEDMSASTVDYKFAIALNYPYENTPSFVACDALEATNEGFWVLRDIPVNPLTDDQRVITTSWREGFYVEDPQIQSNIKNWNWVLFKNDPKTELSTWRWRAHTSLSDSWAWTHCVHAVFAFHTTFELLLLSLVVVRRLRAGHIWIGDAFSSISSTLLYRGVLVVASNHINGYYTWNEYALAIGHGIAGRRRAFFYRFDLVMTDLLTIYLTLVSIVSYLTKERVDPALVFGSFMVGFYYRTEQAKIIPIIRSTLEAYANHDSQLARAPVSEAIDRLSPFSLFSVHHISMKGRGRVIISVVVSVIAGLIAVIPFIMSKKLYRIAKTAKSQLLRELIQTISRTESLITRATDTFRRQASLKAGHQKPDTTIFESATGASLKNHYGILTDYDNHIVEGGRRFASLDAIYANGYIIANRRYLVARADLLAILTIKLTRVRFKNVFVYRLIDEVTPSVTAQLLYPSTISWNDIMSLDVSKLA